MAAAAPTLTKRQLNRALLARQLLLERQPLAVAEAVERVAGVQAQASAPPFIGLWNRIADFHEGGLQRAIDEREVVRATMMRHTVHFVTARDYLWLRPTIQPALEKNYGGVTRKRLAGFDIAPFLDLAREAFAEPLTFAELQKQIEARDPGCDVSAVSYAARTFLRLNGVPNTSRWRFGGKAPFVLAENWLGTAIPEAGDVRQMVRRYLAAFGPATPADATAWSGVGAMRQVFEDMRDELVTYRDEDGRELFDLPDAPLPDPGTGAPARFLPEFDNTLLSHKDRTRVIADEHRPLVYIRAGWMLGTLLLDGFAAATWKTEKQRRGVELVVSPFVRMSRRERDSLEPEADALMRFIAPEAESRTIRFEAGTL